MQMPGKPNSKWINRKRESRGHISDKAWASQALCIDGFVIPVSEHAALSRGCWGQDVTHKANQEFKSLEIDMGEPGKCKGVTGSPLRSNF